jgi:hypothetical protein
VTAKKCLIFQTGRNGALRGGMGGNALQNRCTATVLTRLSSLIFKCYFQSPLGLEWPLLSNFPTEQPHFRSATAFIAPRNVTSRRLTASACRISLQSSRHDKYVTGGNAAKTRDLINQVSLSFPS